MVSSPTFDPTNVPDINADPERYDGVYVNRFLHSTYVPGSTFKLVTAAAALSELDDLQSRTFHCAGSAEVGGKTVICNGVHGDITFKQALAQSVVPAPAGRCPRPTGAVLLSAVRCFPPIRCIFPLLHAYTVTV